MADTLTLLNTAAGAQRQAYVGLGFATQQTLTSNVTFGATETTVITTPSMTFASGRAYKVTVFGRHQWPTTASYALYRIRKGTGTGGTIYVDHVRVNGLIESAATGALVNFQAVLTNTTSAAVTTTITLTGTAGATSQTWTFAATSTEIAYVLVEDCGSTANYSGYAIS